MLKRVIAAHREGAGVGKEAALFSCLNVLPRFQMQLSVSSASCHSQLHVRLPCQCGHLGKETMDLLTPVAPFSGKDFSAKALRNLQPMGTVYCPNASLAPWEPARELGVGGQQQYMLISNGICLSVQKAPWAPRSYSCSLSNCSTGSNRRRQSPNN